MIQPAFEILNQRGTPMFFSDVFANRPTAGIVGRIFISTDTKEFYRDTGSTWELLAGPGSGTVTGSGAAGQVTFWNGTTSVTGSNNLWWDNASNKFLVGTNNTAGAGALQVTSATGDDQLRVWGATSPSIRIDNAVTGATQRFVMGLATATNNFIQGSAAGNICISTASANPLLFGMWQTINASEVMRISTANNLLIGSSVDTGQRVQITGTTQITPASNATALSISGYSVTGSNTNSVLNITGTWNTTGNPTGIFLGITSTASASNSLLIDLQVNSSSRFSVGTTGFVRSADCYIIGGTATTNTFVASFIRDGGAAITSGNVRSFFSNMGVVPTSGSAVYNQFEFSGSINQTGGANGITRGLYINPTLTAAADWRSIEWSNNSGWGLYGAGTSANYLNGRLGLGSTALTGYGLRNSLPLTGAVVSFGHRNNGVVQSDVTFSAQYLNIAPSTQAAAFTVTNVFGILIDPLTVGAGSTVTNAYAIYSDFASGTNRWNFYANGTANNFFNGSIGLASTNLTGFSLRVGKSLTGAATTYGIFSEGTILSDVTSATYVSTFASVLNTAFTVANLRHFIATGSTTFGAATVSAQSGFTADNALTGATNNYGFRGLISSGTGRWNLFMDGAGANHMAGNLLLGSTTNPGQQLYVNGTIRIDGQTSATAGGSAGLHLILNLDGTNYKIALLNV